MHAEDLDVHATGLLRAIGAADVQFVLLEDEDPVAITLVPGPSSRNLDRLGRVLKRLGATVEGTHERLDVGAVVRDSPRRWPLRIAGVTVDLVRVGVDDGRWGAYYDQACPTELESGLQIDVVPDAAVIGVRRADAFTAMPELALTRRERERFRRRQRDVQRRAERRGARRQAVARLVGRR